MNIIRVKVFSAAMGCCALLAAALFTVIYPEQTSRYVAGGSGDSATTTVYTQPQVYQQQPVYTPPPVYQLQPAYTQPPVYQQQPAYSPPLRSRG